MKELLFDFDGELSRWIYPAVVLICVLLVNRALHFVLAFLRKRCAPTSRVWLNACWSALDAPLQLLVWILGASITVLHFFSASQYKLVSQIFQPASSVLVIVVASWFLVRLVNRVEQNLRARAAARGESIDPTAAAAIGKLCWVLIFILAALGIMQALGVSIGGLLAFGGAAGIAIGFAAQTLVANLFGGLTVFASRIFKIGDYIIIPGTSLMGEVREIGWRSTQVVGFDRKPFYVPNSVFNSSTVINHSRMERRCIEQYIHLRYEDIDKVKAIVEKGNALIAAREDIDQEFWVFRFDSYGDRTLKLFLYAFPFATAYVDFMRIKEELLLSIAAIVQAEGGNMSLPVTHVSLPEDGRSPAPLAV